MKLLSKAWRSTVQACSFALFGLGAWGLTLVLFPLIWIAPVSEDKKTAFIQKVIHYFFRLFLDFIELVGAMEFRIEGLEHLDGGGGGIVIANHPTLLDVVLIISRMPQADCIVKKELWANWFLKGMIASAGYIPNVGGPELLAVAIERVKKGRKVIVFPEGTRSPVDAMHPFNLGFAHIAVRAPCKLWPVVLQCVPPALRKGHGLLEVPDERARLSAVAQTPLDPSDFYDSADSASLAVRKVSAAVRRYFEEKLGYGRS